MKEVFSEMINNLGDKVKEARESKGWHRLESRFGIDSSGNRKSLDHRKLIKAFWKKEFFNFNYAIPSDNHKLRSYLS
jgi:hypothetical protein